MNHDDLSVRAERSQASSEQLSPVYEDSAIDHFSSGADPAKALDVTQYSRLTCPVVEGATRMIVTSCQASADSHCASTDIVCARGHSHAAQRRFEPRRPRPFRSRCVLPTACKSGAPPALFIQQQLLQWTSKRTCGASAAD